MIVSHDKHDDLEFLQLHLGGDRNFQYLVGDPRTGKAVAVDPGYAEDQFVTIAGRHGLTITDILITHGHNDHMGRAAALARLTGAVIHAANLRALPDGRPLADGQLLRVGGLVIRALATPGHAPDHYCFLCGDHLITGDLLFCGKVGGTGPGFPGSSARQEWDSLQGIMLLPPETRVYPGHDYYGGQGAMPFSTVGQEKSSNPFLTSGGFDEFCALKANWAAYKQEHGIR